MKYFYLVLIAFFCSVICVHSQLIAPYNLDFEESGNGSIPVGWGLGNTARDSNFTAVVTNIKPFSGAFCVQISNPEQKVLNNVAASFYQPLFAENYKNKKVRFSVYVKIQELETEGIASSKNKQDIHTDIFETLPHIFISAKNRQGENLATQQSSKVNLRGWNLFSAEMFVPDNASELRIGISVFGTHNVWLDNCKLEIISNDSLYYAAPSPLTKSELDYIVPFANLVGVIRYFHPTKSATEANWDDVILSGINQSKNIPAKHIKDSLRAFFSSLAPTLQLSDTANTSPLNFFHNKEEQHKYLLAWMHQGIPSEIKSNVISSSKVVDINGAIKYEDAVITQYVRMKDIREKEITLKVKSKVQKYHKGAIANISIRFENQMGDFISFLKKDSIISDEWNEYTLSGRVPDSCTSALIILAFKGYGNVHFDDVRLSYKDGKEKQDKPIILKNPSFEYTLNFDNNNWLVTNEAYNQGYRVSYSEEHTDGKQDIVIYTDPFSTPYFPAPASFTANINQALRTEKTYSPIYASLPIYIPAEFYEIQTKDSNNKDIINVSYQTFPEAPNFKPSTGKNDDFNLCWKDRDSRIAMVIKVYNLLQYFAMPEINKDTLDTAFVKAVKDIVIADKIKDVQNILQSFIDVTRDNRAKIWTTTENQFSHSLHFNIDYVGGELLISNIQPNNSMTLQNGDEIIEIDGKDIPAYLGKNITNRENKYDIQKKIATIKYGNKDSKVKIKIKNQGGNISEYTFTRSIPSVEMQFRAIDYSALIHDSIMYLDFTAFRDRDLFAVVDSLPKYHNWIIDLRGESTVSEAFIGLLYDSNYYSSIQRFPYYISPNEPPTSCITIRDTYTPTKNNRLAGKFIFLIDWRTYGNGELFASVVKELKLGTLVGNKTQGALIAGVPTKLDNEFMLSLGTMLGFSPSGIPILNNPITPDIEVDINEKNFYDDPILKKAISILEDEKEKVKN